MLTYITRRIVLAIFTVWAVSVLAFVIIQLPPGDYITSYIAQMAATGSVVSEQEAENLRIQYGLDQPIYVQYFKWMAMIVQGNFGMSMEWRRPVTEVIGDRLWLTMIVSFAALLLTWVLALPIGIYSAVRQYSLGDYTFTFIGFIGLAVPNFLLALVILYFGFVFFDANIGGLFSVEYQDAPWSVAKIWDMVKHLPIPALILGLAGTAQQIRIMRANLLDELQKPYVVTARAKGLSEAKVVVKYPVRVALNPFASTIGYLFPYIVSGSIIVSLVLSLPTVGPLLLKALIAQDMFLAGTIVLMLGVMTVIGTLVSDIHSRVDRPAHSAGGHLMAETRLSFDPLTTEAQVASPATTAEERIFVASQWQLMWWRFRKHKLAMVSGVIVIGFYLAALGADFLAYADPNTSEAQRSLMPPQLSTCSMAGGSAHTCTRSKAAATR